MHLYSILVAAVALTVSTAFARNEYQQKVMTDCLNICNDGPDDYTCPPDTEKTQLSSVCSSFEDLFYHCKRLTFKLNAL